MFKNKMNVEFKILFFAFLVVLFIVDYFAFYSSIYFYYILLVVTVTVGFLSFLYLRRYNSTFKKKIKEFSPYYVIYRELANSLQSDNKIIPQVYINEIKKFRDNSENQEIEEILCRKQFKKMMSHWDQPDTIASSHALASLTDLSSPQWIDKKYVAPIDEIFFSDEALKNTIFKRRFSYFDHNYGCWYANKVDKSPSLDAAYAALKTTEFILTSKKKDCSIENLESIVGEGRINLFKKYFKKCYDPNTGGFTDWDVKKPNVTSTGLAIRISSIILNCKNNDENIEERMRELFNFNSKPSPKNFIKKCCKEIKINDNYLLGFTEDPSSQELWICITYFAVTALKLLNELDFLLNLESKRKLVNLLDECLKPRITKKKEFSTKGYVATPGFYYEDLMHTFYSLKLLDILYPSYLKRKHEKFFLDIKRFVDTCKSGYGYGFRMNFGPNVYTTCLARHIYNILKEYCDKIPDFNTVESLAFYASCYNKKENAFSGYPSIPQD